MDIKNSAAELRESIQTHGVKDGIQNHLNGESVEVDDDDEKRIDIDELDGEELQSAMEYLTAIGKETNRREIEKSAFYLKNIDSEEELISAFETKSERGRVDHSIVAPQNMEEETTWHTRDGNFYQILTVTSLPRLVQPGWLVPLTLSEHDVKLSMHMAPRDTKSVKGRLQQRLTQMKSAIQWKKKRGRTDVYEEEHERKELERLLRSLISGTTKIFNFGFYLEVRGDTLEEMKEASRSVRRKVSEQGMDLIPIEGRQVESQQAMAPVGTDPIQNNNAVQLEAMSTFFNFIEPPVNQPSGVLMGFDDSKRPVIVDRFELSGHSKVVTGKVGGGKTYSTKMAMYRRLLNDDDVRLIIFDPLGDDFVDFTQKVGGSVINFGGEDRINPLQIEPPRENENIRDAYTVKVRSAIEIIKTFFDQAEKQGMNAGEEGVITQCVHYAYAKKGITSDPETFHKESPIIDDVIEGARVIANGGIMEESSPVNNAMADGAGTLGDCSQRTREIIQDPSPEYVRIASEMVPKFEPFKEGSVNYNLNGHTNIDLQDRVICFNMESFADTGEMPLIMHTMLDWAYQEARRSPEKIDVTFEEAHYLLGRAGSRKLLNLFIRHARHFSAGLTLVSQTPDEFLNSEEKKEIYDNCDIKQLFYQENVSDDVIDYFDFSDEEARFLRQAARGQNSDFSECLLSTSEHGRRRLEIYVDPFERHILDEDLDPYGYLTQLGYNIDDNGEHDSKLNSSMPKTASLPDSATTSLQGPTKDDSKPMGKQDIADTTRNNPEIKKEGREDAEEEDNSEIPDPYSVRGGKTEVEDSENPDTDETLGIEDSDPLNSTEINEDLLNSITDNDVPTVGDVVEEQNDSVPSPTPDQEQNAHQELNSGERLENNPASEVDDIGPATPVEEQPENQPENQPEDESKEDVDYEDLSKVQRIIATIKNMVLHVIRTETFKWAAKVLPIALILIIIITYVMFGTDLII